MSDVLGYIGVIVGGAGLGIALGNAVGLRWVRHDLLKEVLCMGKRILQNPDGNTADEMEAVEALQWRAIRHGADDLRQVLSNLQNVIQAKQQRQLREEVKAMVDRIHQTIKGATVAVAVFDDMAADIHALRWKVKRHGVDDLLPVMDHLQEVIRAKQQRQSRAYSLRQERSIDRLVRRMVARNARRATTQVRWDHRRAQRCAIALANAIDATTSTPPSAPSRSRL